MQAHILHAAVAATLAVGLASQDPISLPGIPGQTVLVQQPPATGQPGRIAPGLQHGIELPAELPLVTDTVGGTVWVGAETYKAGFDAHGLRFLPFLGSDAERSTSVHFARARVRVGGKELNNADVDPRLCGTAVVFADAAHEERYELRTEGVEQQFVFAALPERSAIEVAVAVDADLPVVAGADGFRFHHARGSFGYGHAIAIDADGRRLALETELRGNELVTVVPQWFVAAASLPLCIDPLIGNVQTLTMNARELRSADIAYDATLERYALVYERVWSAADSDVYLQLLDNQMAAVGLPLVVDLTSTSWRRPRVAGVNGPNVFLCVAEVSTGNQSPFRVAGRILDGVAGTLAAPFDITTGADATNPDVGGDSIDLPGARFCVVWERHFSPTDHDIMAVMVTAAGAIGAVLGIETNTSFEGSPTISKTCGSAGGYENWAVALVRRLPNGVNSEVRVNTVSRGGTVNSISSSLVFGALPTTDVRIAISSPTAAALGRRFAVAARHALGASHTTTWLTAVNIHGALAAQSLQTVTTAPPAGDIDLDSDGYRFALVGAFGDAVDPTVGIGQVSLFGIGNGAMQLQDMIWLPNYGNVFGPTVVATASGGGGDSHYGIAWTGRVAPSSWQPAAVQFHGVQSGNSFAVRSTACGNLGMSGSGSTALGGTTNVQLQTNNGILGFVVGYPISTPLGFCPGCTQGVDGATSFGGTYSITFPRNPALVGATLACQGFQILLPGQGSCLGQINLSNTVDMTIR